MQLLRDRRSSHLQQHACRDQQFTASNAYQGGDDADTDTGEDPEDGVPGGLEVEWVEVAEVAPGQRCGDDD
ncbi:MAG TPA: hypothetical protein VJ820_05965 [Propionibacteriaceae bacterium]|nr:hypothetical protein [Propionibacteriaceae bacterium]